MLAKVGGEGGSLGNHFASARQDSRSAAKSFSPCEFALKRFFVGLRSFASCCGLFQLDVTRNVTQRGSRASLCEELRPASKVSVASGAKGRSFDSCRAHDFTHISQTKTTQNAATFVSTTISTHASNGTN